jgi:hypothetical protein
MDSVFLSSLETMGNEISDEIKLENVNCGIGVLSLGKKWIMVGRLSKAGKNPQLENQPF